MALLPSESVNPLLEIHEEKIVTKSQDCLLLDEDLENE
jgi:hypothetical protein